MWSIDIEKAMVNVPNFLGVFSRDNLPEPQYYPYSLIANTDKQDESGTHWIAIYVDINGNGIYFDSYGEKPYNAEFKNYLDKFCIHHTWSDAELQCLTCVTCGEYCCCYVILRTAGLPHDSFLELFSDNGISNDLIVKNLFKNLN